MAASTKLVIGFPRWTPDAVLTGGSFAAAYPAANLNALPLARVARTSDCLLASTQFVATLPKKRPVRLFGLVGHNGSISASFRISLYDDTGLTTLNYTTGWLPLWPVVYPLPTCEWDAEWCWTGKYTADQIAGYTWTRPVWLDRVYRARAIKVEIDDQSNAAGYFQMGLFEIAQGFQAKVNFGFGAQYGYEFNTAGVKTPAGGEYFDRQGKARVFQGSIENAPRDDAQAIFLEHLRQADLDTPFLVMPLPGETDHWLRTVYLARYRDPGLYAFASAGRDRVPLSWKEVIV